METNNSSLLTRVIAVVGAAAIVLGVWYLTSREQTDQNDGAVSVGDDQVIEAGSFGRDSDNDGLRDWEESLWGTDSENPDTDGDGTSDGDEVNNGRDPNSSEPNDTLEESATPIYAREDSSLTVSESFQKDMMERLSQLNQSGDVTEAELQELLFQLSEEYIENPEIASVYSSANFQTTNNSEAAVRTYLNTMGEITLEYRETFSAEKLLAIQRIFGETSADPSQDIETLITSFNAVEGELTGLAVPSELAEEHVDILNGSATMRTTLANMLETYETDPLNAIIELNSFRSGLLLFGGGVEDISTYTQQSGITFSQDDPAQLFLSIQ